MEIISKLQSLPLAAQGAVGSILALLISATVHVFWIKRSGNSKIVSLPPGPPRTFLLGNLLQFPKDHFYDKFCEWQKEYGKVETIQSTSLFLTYIFQGISSLCNSQDFP